MNSGQEGGVGVSPDNGETPTKTTKQTKRTDFLLWDQYFMGVALIAEQRSMHPNTKVGVCFVNPRKRIVGIGYIGMPDNSDKSTREKEPNYNEMKPSSCVCHAEMNAIVKKMDAGIQGCTLYTTLYPCDDCSEWMISSGIKEVFFLRKDGPDTNKFPSRIKKYQPMGDLNGNLKKLTDVFDKL